MSFLIQFAAPAIIISSAVLLALHFLQDSSVGLRSALTLFGLLAWFLPWHRIMLPVFAAPALPIRQWMETSLDAASTTTSVASTITLDIVATTFSLNLWLGLFVPGALLFLADLCRHCIQLRKLEQASLNGEKLRVQLPDFLRSVPDRIRIIPQSPFAAVTGLWRRTIWIGAHLDGHADLQAALVHECCHLQRNDILRMLLLTLVRRLYCWNPLVYLLSRHKLLQMEQACDERCTNILGRLPYQRSLARLMLESGRCGKAGGSGKIGESSTMVLLPMIRGGSHDYRRIKALEAGAASGIKLLGTAGIVTAALVLALGVNAQVKDPRIGEWRQDRNSPNLQGLYRIFEDLGNGITRTHIAANLAVHNQLYVEHRCNDGNFHLVVDAAGASTGRSSSCSIIDASTVLLKTIINEDPARIISETSETISSDGLHYTVLTSELNRDGEVTQTRAQKFTRNSESCLNADWATQRQCLDRSRPPR